MNKLYIIIILCIVILLYLLYNVNSAKKEYLTYTNNCYNSLEKEIQILKELDCSYCNSVAPDESISNLFNERDNDVYNIFSTV